MPMPHPGTVSSYDEQQQQYQQPMFSHFVPLAQSTYMPMPAMSTMGNPFQPQYFSDRTIGNTSLQQQ